MIELISKIIAEISHCENILYIIQIKIMLKCTFYRTGIRI